MQWLRRSFITGFFVTVPLIISVAALVWIFGVIDGAATPVSTRLFGRNVPGLGVLITLAVILTVGVVATNVIGKQLLQHVEGWLLQVPVFRTIYAPVKQLVVAFSPDNEAGFKKVVLVDDERRGMLLGFLTREFTFDRGQGPEAVAAVYVPTNHLYLGDVVVYPRDRILFPDLSVEEGLRVFLTGGVALPPALGRVGARSLEHHALPVRE
ncbi:MAG: DUF502 domain-containing protein [Vicinamibacterales bacterium]